MSDDTGSSWELRRPDLVLREIEEQYAFDRPRTLLARVDGPYDEQQLVGVTLLWDEPPADELERTRLTEEALERLRFSRLGGASYRSWPLAVPVVVRPGPVWSTQDEGEALLGLRYGANAADVRQGDVLTVTGRGWYCFLDELCGTTPRARWPTTSTPVAG